MVDNKVLSLILGAVKEVSEKEQVELSDRFEDLDMDSLDLIELQAGLQEEFDVTIPDDRWELLKTVEEVVNLVEEILSE